MLIEMLKFMLLGAIATFFLDVLGIGLAKIFKTKTRNWGTVGQWLKGLCQFKWVYVTKDYPQAPDFHEQVLGWGFHYAVGMGYGLILFMLAGTGYLNQPTLLPALWVGLVLPTLASWLIFMPCMGAGLFGHKAKNIKITVFFVLSMHVIFMLGLYLPVCLSIYFSK